MRACHRRIDSKFVNKYQALDRIGFVVTLRLFFRDNPSSSRARQIVGTLASARALFFIC
jgi:hypothetical protein